jgi:hypothetical protein
VTTSMITLLADGRKFGLRVTTEYENCLDAVASRAGKRTQDTDNDRLRYSIKSAQRINGVVTGDEHKQNVRQEL